jgi:exodeoxyribonuclease V alpha subunit
MPTLNATVQRVAYPPPTTVTDGGEAWMILITSAGVCKGKMPWRPQIGEQLILQGEYSVYKGEREFAFSGASIDVPANPRDQLRYVCTRTPGLGPAAEALIWQHSGANWTNIPPGAVPRLNGKLHAEFMLQIEAMTQKSQEAATVAALMGKGCTMNLACKAWSKWGVSTLGVVNADPFRLAELDGYSFRDVDLRVRAQYGISDDDKRRIRAGVLYSLRRLTDAGDTVVTWDALYRQACGVLCGFSDLISECAGELFQEGAIRAFGENGEGVALASDYAAEESIWMWVESAGRTNNNTQESNT